MKFVLGGLALMMLVGCTASKPVERKDATIILQGVVLEPTSQLGK